MTSTTSAQKKPRVPGKRQRFARTPGSTKTAQPTAPVDAAEPAARKTKSDTLIELLSRPYGATIEQMMAATGWQAHSVRGFLAGTLKKKPGVTLSSSKTDTGRIYSVAIAPVTGQ